jgi:hypothetical protein
MSAHLQGQARLASYACPIACMISLHPSGMQPGQLTRVQRFSLQILVHVGGRSGEGRAAPREATAGGTGVPRCSPSPVTPCRHPLARAR